MIGPMQFILLPTDAIYSRRSLTLESVEGIAQQRCCNVVEQASEPFLLLSLAAFRIRSSPCDTRFPLCVGSMRDRPMFSFICTLPCPTSAAAIAALVGGFTGTTAQSGLSNTCMSAVRL